MSDIKKPIAKIIEENGNVFNLIGICSKALKDAGLVDQIKEMTDKVFESSSYKEALNIMEQYCEFA